MRSRSGFARLTPLVVLTGLAAGTIALLASARPVGVTATIPAQRWVDGYEGGLPSRLVERTKRKR